MLRTTRHLPLLAALACVAAPALPQPVYKCVADNGKVTYSQNPCYGEQWHRLGEKAPQSRKSSETTAPVIPPADAPANAIGARPAAMAAQAAAPVAPAAAAAASTTATRP